MAPLVLLIITAIAIGGVLVFVFRAPKAPKAKPMTMKWTKDIRPVINWPVLLSDEIQECLPDNKAEAITRYRKQADVEQQQAEKAIEYSIAFPDVVPAPVR